MTLSELQELLDAFIQAQEESEKDLYKHDYFSNEASNLNQAMDISTRHIHYIEGYLTPPFRIPLETSFQEWQNTLISINNIILDPTSLHGIDEMDEVWQRLFNGANNPGVDITNPPIAQGHEETPETTTMWQRFSALVSILLCRSIREIQISPEQEIDLYAEQNLAFSEDNMHIRPFITYGADEC